MSRGVERNGLGHGGLERSCLHVGVVGTAEGNQLGVSWLRLTDSRGERIRFPLQAHLPGVSILAKGEERESRLQGREVVAIDYVIFGPIAVR